MNVIRLRDPETPSKTAIAGRLRDMIRSGALPLGTRISDKDLAAHFGVSRTPVREALVLLESEGLVVIKPQSGTFVFDLSPDDIRQICTARTIIETSALKLALEKASSDAPAQLGLLIGRASVALDDGDFQRCDELDSEFHETLVGASGNGYLIKAYAGISDRLRALRQRMPRDRERLERAIVHHRKIVDLWAANRADRAVAELAAHVDNVERLLTSLDRRDVGPASAEN